MSVQLRNVAPNKKGASKNSISIKLFHSITDTERSVWNEVVPETHGTGQWDFFNLLEKTEITDKSSRFYFLIYNNGEAVAAAFAQIMVLSLAKLSPPPLRKWLSLLGRFQSFKFLICGNYISDGLSGIFTRDKSILPTIIPILERQVSSIQKERKLIGTVYKEFMEDECNHLNHLERSGYIKTTSLPYHYLPINWDSLEDYCKALRKRYRQSFKKNRKKINHNDISVVVEPANSFDIQDIYNLYEFVHNSAPFQLEKVAPEFFKELPAILQGKGVLLFIKQNEKILGFSAAIETKSALQALYLGYDSNLNGRYDIYFNIAFELVNLAIKLKKDVLSLGQTADAFKLRIGCSNKNTYFYFGMRKKLTHWIFSKCFPLLFPMLDLKPHNVFKNL